MLGGTPRAAWERGGHLAKMPHIAFYRNCAPRAPARVLRVHLRCRDVRQNY